MTVTARRFRTQERNRQDAYTVGVTDAVLGTTLTVPTPEDSAAVKIPAGTQLDATLRLRGAGLPRFSGHGRGDLFIRVQVRVPEKLSREEKALYERLRGLAATPRKVIAI